jgi:predicted regulator of Ras-like GTPase activity (Roadblock/LC7/MglB family)
MKSILENIVALRGVHYACIYQSGEVLASTFPGSNQEGVSDATQAVEQIFSALEAIGQAHNEVYLTIGEMLLIAYLFDDENLVILLTDSKINFPLIHMGVKSASVKIKAFSPTQNKTPLPSIPPPPSSPIKEETPPQIITPEIQEEEPTPLALTLVVQGIMDSFEKLLIDYLGPAAVFVFEDGVDLWREKYIPTEDTLINLAEILALELNPGDERNDFIAKAKGYL